MKLKKTDMVYIAILAVVVIVWTVKVALSWAQCGWYGHQTQRDTRYAAFVGCMVKTGDHWVPRTELRTEQ